ncbi:FAD/NAD(P)-binding oxidoreductase [Erythrobacter alti]|uniref:NAD(P)/FAD-dependent oxidoreductase n=1 Tax=Erythrobacter alti TaxID=1896145 RepID=UPI0030F4518F
MPASHTVLIIGGGAAGIATASSLLKRRSDLDIAIVEPADTHSYQPGWTMVGGGIFKAEETRRTMESVMPAGVTWIKQSAVSFQPDRNQVTLEDGSAVTYDALVVAPGIRLAWEKVDGLEDALGKNGVTSNYRYDLAPYTWELVRSLKSGRAIFTQPPMPIKCAGAPQKAMYLSCDHWMRSGVLDNIDVEFRNAGGVLFGVAAYVPALMDYVEKYDIALELGSNLIAVDGSGQKATFATEAGEVTCDFDMLHVVPPQVAPQFLADSPLAGESGFTDVDQHTLRHVRYDNVFGLGDAGGMPNAKTAAAVRKQAPVVAVNLLRQLGDKNPKAGYDGYGSCPLTVERGKIVLAEFGYDGKLLPSFPKWLINGTRPQHLSWILKADVLPWVYWNAMLKGREWLASPKDKSAS